MSANESQKVSLAAAHFETMSRVFALILLVLDIKNLNLGGLGHHRGAARRHGLTLQQRLGMA